MKCNMKETTLLDYFYNELPEEERVSFERHLKSCAACREALDDLNLTSKAMSTWDVPDPKLNMVFVAEKQSLGDKIKELLPAADIFSKSPLKSFAYGLAAVFLLFSLTNFEVSYNGDTGTFAMSTSVFGKSSDERDPDYEFISQQIIQTQSEMLKLVNQVISDRESKQQEQTYELVDQVADELTRRWEDQRDFDMRNVGSTLNLLREMADENNQYINNNRAMLMDIASTAGVELKKDDR